MYVKSDLCLCGFGVLVAILLRTCTTLHPYSGQGEPPMFGDYEAQRHWMEITLNLPVTQWYRNSSLNDLQYWGLDYPPLTAYHSYLCGIVANFLNPDYVALYKSRGHESEDHKVFMRYTVLIADVFLYLPAVISYFFATKRLYETNNEALLVGKSAVNKEKNKKISCHLSIVLTVLYPGIILIDHGHFQYNCVSLAFFVYAVTLLCINRCVLASILFCLALNYKQMELYHALPFFAYLLSVCVPKPGRSAMTGVIKLCRIGVAVATTFAVIWAPFLFSLDDAYQVLHRVFPIARGVFEDKVANLWCALNVAFKFKLRFSNTEMVRYCTAATLAAVLPTSADLFLRPSIKKFVPALINSSLAFFLFSFQVHEKSVLLVAVPAMLYLPNKPVMCFWLLVITNFSMLPLFVKDDLAVAFVALTAFYVASFQVTVSNVFGGSKARKSRSSFVRDILSTLLEIEKGKASNADVLSVTYKHFYKNRDNLRTFLLYALLFSSLIGCAVLSFVLLVFEPPEGYPDLFPLLISAYCCVHFLGFFAYFNWVQLNIPQAVEDVKHVKVKIS